VLFSGRKPKDSSAVEVLPKPASVPDPATRAASLHWGSEEDALILSLQKQYGTNWNLIADVFNGSTTRPASDNRLGWDIYDRWDKLAGPGSRKVLEDGTEITIPPPEYSAPVDKSGKPHQINLFDGSKKRLRHLTVFDAMRKLQKKREATAPKPACMSFFLPPPSCYTDARGVLSERNAS
jgi:chromatin modification-related protein VID21